MIGLGGSIAAVTPGALAAGLLVLQTTLVLGAKTLASGKNLTGASIVSVVLVSGNASLALGAQVSATISGNNIVLTSLSALNLAVTTDVGTYQVTVAGWS